MNLHLFQNRDELGVVAAKAVEEKILKLLEEQEFLRIVFAAAPSQLELLKYLTASKIIPWNRIIGFHMDEYIGLSNDSPALFSNFLKKNLFDAVPFHQVHLINGEADPELEMNRYATLLNEAPIDIVCLGIGENGHIAFNDPPVSDFQDSQTVKIVELEEACKQQQVNDGCFDSLEQVPDMAFTLTIPALINGSYLYCVVPGKTKRDAVYQSLFGPVTTACPASILRRSENCDLFLDADSNPFPVRKADEAANMVAIDALSNQPVLLHPQSNTKVYLPENFETTQYIGEGLVDLQINGIKGVDFNTTNNTPEAFYNATLYLLSKGVTAYCPTIVTNAMDTTLQLVTSINEACERYPLVDSCVTGIHLEGPFISSAPGAKGAHPEEFACPPSVSFLDQVQKLSAKPIAIITLAPELEGSDGFIRTCVARGIKVSIGHSMATGEDIQMARDAGASLATHLGNGVPLKLQRHPNIIWELMAQEGLNASLIADGFHLPPSFLKVVFRAKEDKCLLVSDATGFAGMASGEYDAPIGGKVVLEDNGRLSMKGANGLLAGAAKDLLENINYLLSSKLLPLSEAWKKASLLPLNYVSENNVPNKDWVVFELDNNEIIIQKVFKEGTLVYDVSQPEGS